MSVAEWVCLWVLRCPCCVEFRKLCQLGSKQEDIKAKSLKYFPDRPSSWVCPQLSIHPLPCMHLFIVELPTGCTNFGCCWLSHQAKAFAETQGQLLGTSELDEIKQCSLGEEGREKKGGSPRSSPSLLYKSSLFVVFPGLNNSVATLLDS